MHVLICRPTMWSCILLLLIGIAAGASGTTLADDLNRVDNSVLATTIALVGTGDSATLLQRGFHGPLYKTYLQGKFGVGADAISKYICIFGGEEEIDNAPSVSQTLKCSIAPATCALQNVQNPFSCFGSGSGDDASLVWYCQDIFKWRSEAPAVQECLNTTYGLGHFERAYKASAADIYTAHKLIKGFFFTGLPAPLDVIQGLVNKVEDLFLKTCGKSCPLLKKDKDGVKLNIPKSNTGAAFKILMNPQSFAVKLANIDCFKNRETLGRAVAGRVNLDGLISGRGKAMNKMIKIANKILSLKIFAKGPFKPMLKAADKIVRRAKTPVDKLVSAADKVGKICENHRKFFKVVYAFNMFSELVQGLFELMENNLLPVLDMMTCQGASVAYSKGVEVCSKATAPIAPLPYVSCVKEVADVLEQWAYFYDKAIFTKVAEVSTALYDLADDIESAVSPFLDIIIDILEAVERAFGGTVDAIMGFLGKLTDLLPDIKCPPEIDWLCNIDELILDLLSKAFDELRKLVPGLPSLEEMEDWIVNEIIGAIFPDLQAFLDSLDIPDIFDFLNLKDKFEDIQHVLDCALSQITGEPAPPDINCPNLLQQLLGSIPIPNFNVTALMDKITMCNGRPIDIGGSKSAMGYYNQEPQFYCSAGEVPVVTTAQFTCLQDDVICQVDMTGSFRFPCGTNTTTATSADYPCSPPVSFLRLRGNCCTQQNTTYIPAFRNAPASYFKAHYFCESNLTNLNFIPALVLAQSPTSGAVVDSGILHLPYYPAATSANINYLGINFNNVSKAVSPDYLQSCPLQQVITIDQVGMPEPCLVDDWRANNVKRNDLCGMLFASKDPSIGRYACNKGGAVAADYIELNNLTTLSEGSGYGASLVSAYSNRNSCPLMLPCPPAAGFNADAEPIKFQVTVTGRVSRCGIEHFIGCKYSFDTVLCEVFGCEICKQPSPADKCGGIENIFTTTECYKSCWTDDYSVNVTIWPFTKYCYNDVVVFPGDMAALEDGKPDSDIKTLKDIIFSKADGNSKVLVATFVGAETLDTYLKRKLVINCDSFKPDVCNDTDSSPNPSSFFSYADYKSSTSFMSIYLNRKCVPVDNCQLFNSLPAKLRTFVSNDTTSSATALDQAVVAREYISQYNSMYNSCVAGPAPVLLANQGKEEWNITAAMPCQVGSMAYACTGRSTSTKFWKFLWHNSGRKPNQLNMDCGGLGVQGAMVQVIEASMGYSFDLASVVPGVRSLCTSQNGGGSGYSSCTIGKTDLLPLANSIIDQDAAKTVILQDLSDPTNAVGLRVFFTCVCPPGYLSDLGQDGNGTAACMPCPKGQFRSTYDDQACTPCPIGSVPTIDRLACTPCPNATFAQTGFATCQPCGVGEVDVGGNSACLPCDVNQKRPLNETVCLDCEPGYFAYEVSSNESHADPNLLLIASGIGQCHPCPLGFYRGAGDDRCKQCPAGTFAPTEGSAECTPCNAGTYASGLQSTACLACAIGFYCPQGSVNPVSCPDGFVSIELGAKASTQCVPAANIDYDSLVDMPFCTASAANTRRCQSDAPTNSQGAGQGTAKVMSDGDVVLNGVDMVDVTADDGSSGRRLLQTVPTLARSCRELFNILKVRQIVPQRQSYDYFKQQRGNGFCNYGPLNTLVCGYDDGDCCCSTCVKQEFRDPTYVQDPITLKVTLTGYKTNTVVNALKVGCQAPFPACKDPVGQALVSNTSQCRFTCTQLDTAEFPPNKAITNVSGCNSELLGNGVCNPEQNVPACNYDGGDCCPGTCRRSRLPNSCSTCQCLDPNGSRDVIPPELRGFPKDVTLSCVAAGGRKASLPMVPRVSVLDPNDPSFPAQLAFTEKQSIVSVSPSGATRYLISRTWTSKRDKGNNMVTKTQLITVNSPTPPYMGPTGSSCNNKCGPTVSNKVNCACSNPTSYVACLIGHRKDFILADIDKAMYGWGNYSQSACLAQFYQAMIQPIRCEVSGGSLLKTLSPGTCQLTNGGKSLVVQGAPAGAVVTLTYSITMTKPNGVSLSVTQSGVFIRVAHLGEVLRNPISCPLRVLPTFWKG